MEPWGFCGSTAHKLCIFGFKLGLSIKLNLIRVLVVIMFLAVTHARNTKSLVQIPMNT